jgi:ATP-dependent exoDNAse (exonuclease V) beta subunit
MYDMGANVSLKKFGVGGKFVCDKGRTLLDLENGVYPEYLISNTSDDNLLRLAGQIDLLVKEGNDIIIMDWKTNKEIKTKSGFDTKTKSTAKMLYPLGNLDDCNYYHYTLQLSTYAWMIQQINPNFRIKDLIMVHFDHNNKQTVYHLDYLKEEVEKMLAHYKKQVVRDNQRAKHKRIEY